MLTGPTVEEVSATDPRPTEVDQATVGQIRGSSLLLVGRLISLGITLATQVLIATLRT